VGADEIDVTTMEIDGRDNSRHGEKAEDADVLAEKPILTEEHDTEIVLTGALDDVGIEALEFAEAPRPVLIHFHEKDDVGTLFTEEGEDIVDPVVGREDIEGDDFEFGWAASWWNGNEELEQGGAQEEGGGGGDDRGAGPSREGEDNRAPGEEYEILNSEMGQEVEGPVIAAEESENGKKDAEEGSCINEAEEVASEIGCDSIHASREEGISGAI